MKLLVFAHTPPPHHGQSYMVKLMLDHFGGDARAADHSAEGSEVHCYHVNSRYSEDLEDIGSFRLGKVALMLRYCAEAIWCRVRYGVRVFYYVPAPGKRAALYRDWMVMLICRPFFRQTIYHWHATGLGDWLEHEANAVECWITHRLLGRPTLGLSLAVSSMRDALWFRSGSVELVSNGIPDPCPDFAARVLPRRLERVESFRAKLAQPVGTGSPTLVRVLYLAHCTASKGLFDALEATALANAHVDAAGRFSFHLTVAGAFVRADEQERFETRVSAVDLRDAVSYVGFVAGEAKERLLTESDFLCFPTYYEAEGQPVNLIEAMSVGLPVVTTHWRTIPDLLPAGYPGIVPIKQPAAVAEALVRILPLNLTSSLRERFAAEYTEDRHLEALRRALDRVERDSSYGF